MRKLIITIEFPTPDWFHDEENDTNYTVSRIAQVLKTAINEECYVHENDINVSVEEKE